MSAPAIYLAHPITGEYLGSAFADPDPLDAEHYLVPAHAYLDAPPTAAHNQVAVRTEQGWQLLEDFRGTLYHTSTGNPVEHTELGPLPAELSATPRPSPAHIWQQNGWVFSAELKARNHSALSAQLCQHIDTTADYARISIVGDALRSEEYKLAASEAQTFQEAGYPADDVPRTVAAWAVDGRTAQQAAEDILAQASSITEVLYRLREVRLAGKAQVRALMAADDSEQARLVADTCAQAINTAAAGIGNNIGN
ncbi:hypothetical protein [Pseudomonas sp. 5P_3.1_Bac2]|uniref:hypothetical protein n=1 Tax=Pseudomonas sp. 5P_3.1_Bac2 TaxID=2971617 RepID=UPI0021C98924|nr:hypothetical protein [Pseudomonas sp. 5P_3.1_Bac2]MCU1718680.1 hypothetical protein [Pseudomonas sp. 5P_3.1_Bac2]